jgi:hypothetical protein
MHNCKATREMISELLLTEGNHARDISLSNDLENCDECRAEFDSVKNTLRITTKLFETVTPPDNYWTAYHATLKQKLINSETIRRGVPPWAPLTATHERAATEGRPYKGLAGFLKSSVRVPVPVAIALLLTFALSLLLVARVSRKGDVPTPPPSLVRVPVEVPVIKEKPVIRVVYRDRNRRTTAKRSNRATGAAEINSTVAKSQSRKGLNAFNGDARPAALAGFKPLDEIKLTVIKGGSPDEK